MSESLVEQKKHERKFLEQLLNPKLLCEYEVSVPIKAELRQYQQVRSACPYPFLYIVYICRTG